MRNLPIILFCLFALLSHFTPSYAQGEIIKAKGGNLKKGEKTTSTGCIGITYQEHPSKGRRYSLAYDPNYSGIKGRFLKLEYSIIEKMDDGRYYAVSEEGETSLIIPQGRCGKTVKSISLPPFQKVEPAGFLSDYTPPGTSETLKGPVFLGIMEEEEENGQKRYDGYLFLEDLTILRIIPSIKPVEDFLVSKRKKNGLLKTASPNIYHPNPDLRNTFLVETSLRGYIFCLDHPEGSMYMLANDNFEKTVPVFPDLYPFGRPRSNGVGVTLRYAILLDQERHLFLPIGMYGTPFPLNENGLKGYIPLGPNFSRFLDYSAWGNKEMGSTPPISEWMKYFEIEGRPYFGMGSSGPIWTGMKPEEFDKGYYYQNFTMPVEYRNIGKTTMVAQDLDGDYRVYVIDRQGNPSLFFRQKYASKKEATDALRAYDQSQKRKQILAEAAEREEEARRAVEWARKDRESKRKQFDQWLSRATRQDYVFENMARFLGVSYMVRYCQKFGGDTDRNMLWSTRNWTKLNSPERALLDRLWNERLAIDERKAEFSRPTYTKRNIFEQWAKQPTGRTIKPVRILTINERMDQWERYHRHSRRNGYRQSFNSFIGY